MRRRSAVAEVPNPVRLVQQIGYVVRAKVLDAVFAIDRRVRAGMQQFGPRDN
jgi:hypothetical protein